MSEGSIKGIVENYDCLNTFLQTEVNTILGKDPSVWRQVSSGGQYSAAISLDGSLWTWGRNTCGALGDGTTLNRCSPKIVFGEDTNWCQVSLGSNYQIAAIKYDGTLWTWGRNLCGVLGDGTTIDRCSPGTVAGGGTNWCQVSAGDVHISAIKTDGTLWTWGRSTSNGGLGDGTTLDRCSPGTVAGAGTNWCQVSTGSVSTAAIKCDGTLWTWGRNYCGRLGDGTTTSRCSPGTVAGGGTNWCQVSSGPYYVAAKFAVKCDGTVWTWGRNSYGTLGDGTTVNRCSPGTVAGAGTNWCQVSGGYRFASAVKCDGTIWTWGYGRQGQLSNGFNFTSRSSPGTIVNDGTTWCKVFNGNSHTTAIKTDGTIWTWGDSSFGKLGEGYVSNRCSPGSIIQYPSSSAQDFLLISSAIDNISEHRQVAVASSSELPDIRRNQISNGQIIFVEDRLIPVVANNECWLGLDGRVLRSDAPTRTLFSWGYNYGGRLGDGTVLDRSSPGTIAGGATNWCQVSTKSCHTLAIKTDGTLWTWGYNKGFPPDGGQLGDGTRVNRSSPGTVAGGGTTWCQVSGGKYHSAAVKTDGTLWTWGHNDVGQLGNGTAARRCSPGTIAGGGTNWCQVSGSSWCNTAAIKTDGTLWTWGYNDRGQLGNGNIGFFGLCSPGTVAGGGNTWCRVSNGYRFASAIKTDGTLWTWGANYDGQLGDGTTVGRCSPGTVAGGGTTWCLVSGGCYRIAAIKTDGTLWTWGLNCKGQLGNGTTVARCSPGTIVGGGTTWCWVDSGFFDIAAIKTDGTLWTWGCNDKGQLGDGTTVNRCSPGTVAGGGTTWCWVDSGFFDIAAIKTDGTLWTWGYNRDGNLGENFFDGDRCSPGTIAGGGTNWCQVASGVNNMVALQVQ